MVPDPGASQLTLGTWKSRSEEIRRAFFRCFSISWNLWFSRISERIKQTVFLEAPNIRIMLFSWSTEWKSSKITTGGNRSELLGSFLPSWHFCRSQHTCISSILQYTVIRGLVQPRTQKCVFTVPFIWMTLLLKCYFSHLSFISLTCGWAGTQDFCQSSPWCLSFGLKVSISEQIVILQFAITGLGAMDLSKWDRLCGRAAVVEGGQGSGQRLCTFQTLTERSEECKQ